MRCVVCGGCAVDWHHVFPKSKFPQLRDEKTNLIAVCRRCHANHEVAYRRLPRSAIARAEGLATTDAMRSYLDRTYGPQTADSADNRLLPEDQPVE